MDRVPPASWTRAPALRQRYAGQASYGSSEVLRQEVRGGTRGSLEELFLPAYHTQAKCRGGQGCREVAVPSRAALGTEFCLLRNLPFLFLLAARICSKAGCQHPDGNLRNPRGGWGAISRMSTKPALPAAGKTRTEGNMIFKTHRKITEKLHTRKENGRFQLFLAADTFLSKLTVHTALGATA